MGKTELIVLLAGILLGIEFTATRHVNQIWSSSETLWKDVTEQSPNNGRGWMNYGLALMNRGDYTDAIKAFDTAFPLTPNYWALETNYGIAYGAIGNHAAAVQHFERAVYLGDLGKYYDPYYFYAVFMLPISKPTAIRILEAGHTKQPNHHRINQLLNQLNGN